MPFLPKLCYLYGLLLYLRFPQKLVFSLSISNTELFYVDKGDTIIL